MHQKKQIAIIGGGIAGLTFARCIDESKYEVTIFEKKENFGEIGAAISVFPNALCVMEHINLLTQILNKAGKIEKIYLKTNTGKILSKTEPNYEYPTICMHRADLHGILLNGIQANCKKKYTLKTIKILENKQSELTFENDEKLVFDAVIGADGLHSVVREFILNDGKPIFRGYNIWRGVVDTNFDIGYGSETFGMGQRFGIVPIKNGTYGWWATCNENFMQSDEPENSKDKLKRLFGNWHHPIPDLIAKSENIIKNSLTDRIPKKGWTKGFITLLGDAAHPTSPNLGQGGCMAIEGAFILAQAINKYGISEQAFTRYEALQFPRSKMIVEQSLSLGKMGQITNPIVISLRNMAFRLMPSSVAIKMVDKFFSYRVTKINI